MIPPRANPAPLTRPSDRAISRRAKNPVTMPAIPTATPSPQKQVAIMPTTPQMRETTARVDLFAGGSEGGGP